MKWIAFLDGGFIFISSWMLIVVERWNLFLLFWRASPLSEAPPPSQKKKKTVYHAWLTCQSWPHESKNPSKAYNKSSQPAVQGLPHNTGPVVHTHSQMDTTPAMKQYIKSKKCGDTIISGSLTLQGSGMDQWSVRSHLIEVWMLL